MPLFPSQEHRYLLENCCFADVFVASKLSGLEHLGHIASEGQSTIHPKITSPKQTIWLVRSAKVGQCCGKTAARTGWAWRRPSLLAAAKAFSSQAIVLVHHLKPCFGL
jgi:hypothetical protein